MWQLAWDNAYVILTCTPMAEIQQPIESQVEEIASAVRTVFSASITVCLGCLVFLVLVTINLSSRIAVPIRATVRQSQKIVRNIGGDLFDGISIEDKAAREEGWRKKCPVLAGIFVHGPGEVAAL